VTGVLDVYQQPYNAQRPVVWWEDANQELHDPLRGSFARLRGKPIREGYDYEREDAANLFLAIEPLRGRRTVRVTDRHTKYHFADQLRLLADYDYPDSAGEQHMAKQRRHMKRRYDAVVSCLHEMLFRILFAQGVMPMIDRSI
jgi:hypothetical protein